MPRSIRIFRLATALVTFAVVGAIMLADFPSARIVAGMVLMFGALQWLFLGALGRSHLAQGMPDASSDAGDNALETRPPAP